MDPDSPKRILVVDDEPILRDVFQLALESDDYDVTTTDDGTRAVDLVRCEDVDLVIMDIRMKEMDGDEALSKMRELEILVPVILASSHGTRENVVEALKQRVRGFISKPLTPKDIRQVVAVLLRTSKEELSTYQQAMQHVGAGDLAAAAELTDPMNGPELDAQSQVLHQAIQAIETPSRLDFLPSDLFDQLAFRLAF